MRKILLFRDVSLIILSLFSISYYFKNKKVPINYNNNNELLSIFSAILVSELIILFRYTIFKKPFKTYVDWYRIYRFPAYIADILILFLFFILGRYIIYKLNIKPKLFHYLLIMLSIQIIHDLVFYFFFYNFPKNKNNMLDYFKKYADELGVFAIFGDMIYVILSVLFSSLFLKNSVLSNIIISIISVYISIYIIFAYK